MRPDAKIVSMNGAQERNFSKASLTKRNRSSGERFHPNVDRSEKLPGGFRPSRTVSWEGDMNHRESSMTQCWESPTSTSGSTRETTFQWLQITDVPYLLLNSRRTMRLANCFRAIGLSGRQWSVLLLVAAFASAAFTTEAAKEKRGRKRKQALEPMDNETGSNNMEIGKGNIETYFGVD